MTFRVQYTNVALTYSRCPYSKEQVLEHLMSLSKTPEEFFIVQEPHKKPVRFLNDSPTHIHCWLKYPKGLNVTNPRYWDLPLRACDDFPPEYEIPSYHPDVKKRQFGWTHYLRKHDNDPLTNTAASYVALARSGEIEKATEAFISMHAKDYVINKDRIDENIRKLSKKPKVDHIRAYDSFTPTKALTDGLEDWDNYKLTKSTLICGPSGIGKTQFLKSFCQHKGLSFKIIRHADQLKRIDPDMYKAIIFDDMNFHHFTREQQIHLLDLEEEAVMSCRHREVTLPAGQIRFFTCNPESFPPFPDLDDHAVHRRVKVIHLDEVKLFAS